MAVGIAGHIVGETLPAERSMPAWRVEYVGSAECCVQWVEAGMAIASSVVGCDVLVGLAVSCDVLGVACGGLSVLRGVHKQMWVGVMGVLGRDG